MTVAAGARFGPYEILGAIGAGGMGEVWKARDTRLDRVVALKTTHGAFSERFEREARAISALNHPHICALYDVGDHDGAGFLVMELVEGAPLKGPLPLDQVLKYGAQICGALDAAHRKGIVHRDLKPDNILVTKAGVKLLDFGLAKFAAPVAATATPTDTELAATKALTGQHIILGTPQYMAPEQIEGREADARTDIFAFGCVLYELLTGQKAFDGKTPSSTMAAILATEPRPMRELQPVTPPALERIVKRCLAKDPDDRWQSARDLKDELEWTAGSASSSRPLPQPVAAARSRSLTTLAAVAFALLSVVLAGQVWSLRPQSQLRPASIAFQVNPPEDGRIDGAPVISPDGRRVVVRVRGATGRSWLAVRSLDALTLQKLPDSDGAIRPTGWSPDSRYISFYVGTHLRKIDVTGGPAQTVCDCQFGAPFTAWSPDGVILITNREGLRQLPATGGTPTLVTTIDTAHGELGHNVPQFLPDGRHFLYLVPNSLREKSATLVGSLDVAPALQDHTPVLLNDFNVLYAQNPAGQGHLLFHRNGSLMAQPFAERTFRVTGEAFPIVQRIGLIGSTTLGVSVSTNGSLAYSSDLAGPIANRQFAWFDRSGAHLGDVAAAGSFRDFALSPDQKHLAVSVRDVSGNTDLWMMDLERSGALRRLTFHAASDDFPVWSPDGTRLAFASGRNGPPSVFLTTSDGVGGERDLGKVPGNPLDWSPDGRSILILRGISDLWLWSDGKMTPFATSEFRESMGRFSRDGRWIAYVSNESMRDEVYVQSAAGGRKWLVSTAGGTLPYWSHDGKSLFYLGADGMLMTLAVRSGVNFEYDAPVPLFRTRLLAGDFTGGYAVSRDGQRFLLELPDPTAGSLPITVVTNWLAGVKKP